MFLFQQGLNLEKHLLPSRHFGCTDDVGQQPAHGAGQQEMGLLDHKPPCLWEWRNYLTCPLLYLSLAEPVRVWSHCFSGGVQTLLFSPSPYKLWQKLVPLGWTEKFRGKRSPFPPLTDLVPPWEGWAGEAREQCNSQVTTWNGCSPSPARGRHPGMEAVTQILSPQTYLKFGDEHKECFKWKSF